MCACERLADGEGEERRREGGRKKPGCERHSEEREIREKERKI